MTELDLNKLAQSLRGTGSVRFFEHDIEPKIPMNTSPSDIAHLILFETFESNQEKFRKDERPQVGEIRYHWKDLNDQEKVTLLNDCSKKAEENAIVKERQIQIEVFDLIYKLLTTQVT